MKQFKHNNADGVSRREYPESNEDSKKTTTDTDFNALSDIPSFKHSMNIS